MFEDRRHLVFAPAAMALGSLMTWLHVHPGEVLEIKDSEQSAEADPVQPRQDTMSDA